jgi:hypothetical protein
LRLTAYQAAQLASLPGVESVADEQVAVFEEFGDACLEPGASPLQPLGGRRGRASAFAGRHLGGDAFAEAGDDAQDGLG